MIVQLSFSSEVYVSNFCLRSHYSNLLEVIESVSQFSIFLFQFHISQINWTNFID